MVYTVSITSQGQISIPAKLRQKLGLHKKQKALVSEREGELIVRPVTDFLELGGSMKAYAKGKKPLSSSELDEVVAQAVVDEYAKKRKRSQ